jgi:hypothetical protein
MANKKHLIYKEDLLAEYDRVHIGEPGKARKLMEDAPTVDAVEVLRCKDCKNRLEGTKMCAHPGAMGWDAIEVEYDDFCSYGERKEK